MSFLGSSSDESKAARRGVIILFAAAGWILVARWNEYWPDYLRLVSGIACLAVAAGLWRKMRWARWLAMGSCYLSVIAGFAMPVILALWHPFERHGEAATRISLFTVAATGAFAVVGYKALGYFRSPAAWSDFSGTEEQRKALARERSSTVVKSAAVVAALLGLLAAARGVSTPSLRAAAPATRGQLPDLVIASLCMSGINLVQAEVRNAGTNSASGEFTITFTDLHGRGGMDESRGRVPKPGKSTYVVLNTAVNQVEEDGVVFPVRLKVDANDKFEESNEANNDARYTIVFRYNYPDNLPPCPDP